MSTMPMCQKRLAPGADPQLWMSPSHPETPDAPAFDMSITVGHNTAVEAGLTRRDVDEWAIYSHGRAIETIDSGGFDSQIVPVEIEGPEGEVRLFDTDEHPRRGLTLEGMSELKVIHPEIEGFTVTAGNAAGVNDAAAAVLLADADHAAEQGLEPLAAIRSWAAVGVAPRRTGMAPIDAIPKALSRAGVAQSDIDLFEINEAFCSVPVATTRALGVDPEICNVNGSGCSLGHPIAATGARMVVSMVHELRRRGASLGCVSMCAGGGMGMAMVIEAR
jgi:acetyl-CoA C-acetyltransferase